VPVPSLLTPVLVRVLKFLLNCATVVDYDPAYEKIDGTSLGLAAVFVGWNDDLKNTHTLCSSSTVPARGTSQIDGLTAALYSRTAT
jgi:hypothetical protein